MFKILICAPTPFSKIGDVVHFQKFDVFKDEKKKSEIDQMLTMLSAFGIRTNVIRDMCLQKFPGILPACASLGSA